MKVLRIESYFKSKEFISKVIAWLVSVDGLTFNQIANSFLISRIFKADAYSMPKSPQIIHDHFVKEFKNTLMIVSEKVNTAKKNRDHFSISFDKSTSVRNHRYMNLNLHDGQSFQSLGMIRVKGSMKSKKAIELFQRRLAKFNFNLDADIVATITGGAGVMMKVGRETCPLHIACLFHAIHLCICDVLYKEKRKINKFNNKNNNANDNEVEEDSDIDKTAEDNLDELPDIVLVSEFCTIITKCTRQLKCSESPQCATITIYSLKTLPPLEKRKLYSWIARLGGIVCSKCSGAFTSYARK